MSRFPICLVAMWLVGCATITTSPEPAAGQPRTLQLQGTLAFEGNREFLPAPLAGLPPADSESPPRFRYRYDARYDGSDLSVLALFNPLTLVGCPTGRVGVTTEASLEVLSNGHVVKRYAARSVASRLRTIYSGDPLTDLRRNALRAAADSIAAQMSADAATLVTIVNAAHGGEQ